MTGDNFTTWKKAPTQVRFPPSERNRGRQKGLGWEPEQGYPPSCLHYRERAPRSLRKTVLGHKADERPL